MAGVVVVAAKCKVVNENLVTHLKWVFNGHEKDGGGGGGGGCDIFVGSGGGAV